MWRPAVRLNDLVDRGGRQRSINSRLSSKAPFRIELIASRRRNANLTEGISRYVNAEGARPFAISLSDIAPLTLAISPDSDNLLPTLRREHLEQSGRR
jgi:hypothetical protein